MATKLETVKAWEIRTGALQGRCVGCKHWGAYSKRPTGERVREERREGRHTWTSEDDDCDEIKKKIELNNDEGYPYDTEVWTEWDFGCSLFERFDKKED